MNLQNNKELVFQSVAQAAEQAQRLKDSVNIIAVTKYVDCETTQELVRTGIQHIGENRVDKFLDKYHALKDENLTWHLIGSLQRRKVKDVINYVDYFHALDSVKLAKEIDKRAEHVIKCFLQVNISKEESKHGFLVEDLEVVLPELEKLENSDLDFGKHVIPSMIQEDRKVYVHTYDSYWKDVGTYDSYLEANLDLIKKSEEVGINLYDQGWKIYTRSEDLAPVRIGVTGSVQNSLICNGCKIEGSVENSVLGPGVTVRKGATVRNSIIFSGTYVDENSHLDTIIADKKTYIGKNSFIGNGNANIPNKERPDLLSSGITVIGKGVVIPDGSIVGKNVRIFAGVKVHDDNRLIEPGETIKW